MHQTVFTMFGALVLLVFFSAAVAATLNTCSDGACDEISFVQKRTLLAENPGGLECDTWTDRGSYKYKSAKTWQFAGGHGFCAAIPDNGVLKWYPEAQWCHGYTKDECIAWCKERLRCDYALWRNSASTCYLYRLSDAPVQVVPNDTPCCKDHHLLTCVTREACPKFLPEEGSLCSVSGEQYCKVEVDSMATKMRFECRNGRWHLPCPKLVPQNDDHCEDIGEICEYSTEEGNTMSFCMGDKWKVH